MSFTRHIVIGDVHGCAKELDVLLGTVGLDQKTQYIFLGDLIHKGPESSKVVERVQALATVHNVVLVQGNHEDKHLRWYVHEQLKEKVGKPNPMQNVEDYSKSQLTKQHLQFLANSYLIYRFKNFAAVHGGIGPRTRMLDTTHMNEVDRKDPIRDLLRLRYHNPQGHMVSLGEERPQDTFWAISYDGRMGHALFGHQPFKTIAHFPHATGLDTGCVYGNYLTAVEITDKISQIYEVKAAEAYAQSSYPLKEQ